MESICVRLETLPEAIEIRDVDVDRFATCGIYVRGAASHSTDVRISDCRLREGARGIVTSNVSYLASECVHEAICQASGFTKQAGWVRSEVVR